MNLRKQLFFHFFECGNNNVIVNLFLTAGILLLFPTNSGDFLVPVFLLLNTFWLFVYIYFICIANDNTFIVSKRGKELLLQFAAFYLLTFLFWIPVASQKFFIIGSIGINLCLLLVHIFRIALKNMILNILEKSSKELSENNILVKLKSYFSNDYYESSLSLAGNNHVHSSINSLITQPQISKVMFNGEMEVQDTALENAEYTFSKINFGDTIADWLTPNYQHQAFGLIKVRSLNNRIFKRCFDILISLFVIVFFLSWMIPLIGLLIKLESNGPIFFRQLRSGLYNKAFWCYKFRSMHVNEKSDEQQATKGDARITNIGTFLRKTSLDEFPQFFNVLKGEMSIVGPRPHMLIHTDFYGNKIEDYMKRLTMKQGLTGWAQIKGHRGETSDIKFMQDRVNHDLWYMHNWSLWLDIKIIVLTFLKIFKTESNVF